MKRAPALLPVLATTLLARGLEGSYRSPDGTAIRLECARGASCRGTLLADKDPTRIGKIFLKDLKPAGDSWKGTALLPNGWEAEATLSLPDDSILRLQVRKALFSRTKEWVRIP